MGAAGLDRGKETTLERRIAVADGIDAAIQPMKPAVAATRHHAARTQPAGEHLIERQHAPLLGRPARDEDIRPRGGLCAMSVVNLPVASHGRPGSRPARHKTTRVREVFAPRSLRETRERIVSFSPRSLNYAERRSQSSISRSNIRPEVRKATQAGRLADLQRPYHPDYLPEAVNGWDEALQTPRHTSEREFRRPAALQCGRKRRPRWASATSSRFESENSRGVPGCNPGRSLCFTAAARTS